MLSRKSAIIMGTTGILLLFLLIAASWTIPFIYESSTMYYKFGLQKIALRIGKIFGITAFVLVLLQLILISRIRLLDRVFALNRLVTFHGINGLIILFCAVAHPLLVMGAENFTMYPLEQRYWPEFLGMGLLLLMMVVIVVSFWRSRFSLSYENWLRMHRAGTALILLGLPVHILIVSDSFGAGTPRYLAFGAWGLIALLLARVWYRRVIKPHRIFAVSQIEPAGDTAWRLEIKPTDGKPFDYAAGQFAFIRPISSSMPKQEHPFTIATSPINRKNLQFIIKAIGDWTRQIHNLAVDDPVYLDGPFGRFSHLSLPKDEPVIMVAGGIGITPMLSMLRYITDVDDSRNILLIWSNRSQEDLFLQQEIVAMKQGLKHLAIHYVFTSKGPGDQKSRRMDRQMLEELTIDYPKSAHLFICGPPGMMKQVRKDAIAAGFSSARVYTEKFRL